MAVLSAEDRKKIPAKEFAGPGRSFPVEDKTHAREAISGATRSEHAGNISTSEEEKIKSEARAKLGEKGGDPPVDHKAAVAKMHPEHVHNLVKHAAAGKFGAEAQQMAQQAQQPAAPGQDQDDQQQAPQRNVSSIFSGGADQSAPAAPASRGSMFAGRGGF